MQDTFWCTTSASWWGTWRTSRNRENRNYKRFGKSCSQTMCSFQLLRWLGFYSLGKIFQGLLYCFFSLFLIINYTLLVFYKGKGSCHIFFQFLSFFVKRLYSTNFLIHYGVLHLKDPGRFTTDAGFNVSL